MACKHSQGKQKASGIADGIPTVQENVTAVLTASTTDVLSHVAIRARSQKVRCLLVLAQLHRRFSRFIAAIRHPPCTTCW